MEDRGLGGGGERLGVAELGSRVRLRRAVCHQVLGTVSFPSTVMKVESFTVEHCGNDFLRELAETLQDSENWDDLQAAQSEARGVLAVNQCYTRCQYYRRFSTT
ncbi:hypothetical protein BT93_B1452 [Corymbia citriodora subsp. variegata]|nr:hypothetical protein BT93_B1452 [Corymbia citriodora subsp. variegata]